MKMIDANELLKELEKVCNSLQTKDTQRADLIISGLYVAKRHIQEMPTVDAVPVIRCKDCEYYDAPYHCVRHMSKDYQRFVEENDYCSLAKRK